MDDKKKKQVREVVKHFRGQPFTDEAIKSYCDRMGFEPISKNDLEDYMFQEDTDAKLLTLYPKVMAELQKLSYIPAFTSDAETKKRQESNDEVRINIAKLLEESAVDYRVIESTTREIAKLVSTTIEMAGTTIFNKASSVLLHIALQRFGGEFTAKNAADYANEVYGVKKSWWEQTKEILKNYVR